MTLEEQIRGLAARGELTHISVACTGGKFKAVYTPGKVFGHGVGEDDDPVNAILLAIEQVGIRPKRPPAKDPNLYGSALPETPSQHTGGIAEAIKEGTLSEWTKP